MHIREKKGGMERFVDNELFTALALGHAYIIAFSGPPVRWMVGLMLDNLSPVQIQSKSSPRLIQKFPVKWPNAWHGHMQPVQQEKQPRQDKIDFFFSAWLSGCSSKALPESIF